MEKSPKGIKLQIRHSYMSKKVRFYFHHLYFQNDRKQKNGVCKKFGHPAEFIACTSPIAKLRPASVLNHRLGRPGDVNLKGLKCPESSDLGFVMHINTNFYLGCPNFRSPLYTIHIYSASPIGTAGE